MLGRIRSGPLNFITGPRLMGQYFLLAGVCRLSSFGIICRRLSGSVTLPAVSAPAAGRVGDRAADIARRASTVTSR